MIGKDKELAWLRRHGMRRTQITRGSPRWDRWHAAAKKRLLKASATQRRLDEGARIKALLNGAKSRAEKRGTIFDLTEEWAFARWTGRCELSGVEFKLEDSAGLRTPSIDRIDSGIGYVQDNCRFIAWGLNSFKGRHPDDEMLALAQAYVGHQIRKGKLAVS